LRPAPCAPYQHTEQRSEIASVAGQRLADTIELKTK
jgi:hypothetical protein